LKVEQVAQGNRAVQAEDAGIRRPAGNDIKGQRFVIHSIRDCKKDAPRFDDSPVNNGRPSNQRTPVGVTCRVGCR